MKPDEIDQSARAIGQAIGVDIAYFSSPEERHFDPLTLAFAIGEVLLAAFFEGFKRGLLDETQQLGEWTAETLVKKLEELFRRPDLSPAAGGVAESASAAREAVKGIGDDRVPRVANAMEEAIELFLVGRGFTPKKARTIGHLVKARALAQVTV